jgi:hypothetical protein
MLASRARTLSSSLLHNGSLRLLSKQSLRSLSSAPSSSSYSFSPHEQALFDQGILDERGLTVFHTLHEMQVNSCKVYADKNLFGTFSEESKQFEWMTFQDYAHQVDRCRAMLKDLGEYFWKRFKVE